MSIIPNALPYSVTSYAITPSSPTGELLTLGRIYDEVGDYASTILDSAHLALTRLCRRRSAAVTRELRRRGILTGEATLPSPLAAPAVPAAHDSDSSTVETIVAQTVPAAHDSDSSTVETIVAQTVLAAHDSDSSTVETIVAQAVPSRATHGPNASSLITMTSDLTQMSISELYHHYLAWPQRHEALIDAGHEPLDFGYEARIIRELQRRTAANPDEQLKKDYCLLTYRNELRNLSPILSLPLDELHP